MFFTFFIFSIQIRPVIPRWIYSYVLLQFLWLCSLKFFFTNCPTKCSQRYRRRRQQNKEGNYSLKIKEENASRSNYLAWKKIVCSSYLFYLFFLFLFFPDDFNARLIIPCNYELVEQFVFRVHHQDTKIHLDRIV